MEKKSYLRIDDSATKEFAKNHNKSHVIIIIGLDSVEKIMDISVHSDRGKEDEEKILKSFSRWFMIGDELKMARDKRRMAKFKFPDMWKIFWLQIGMVRTAFRIRKLIRKSLLAYPIYLNKK